MNMKPIIATIVAAFFLNLASIAQIGGNAVTGEGNSYNSTYRSVPVDLNINSYSSNFSYILEANVMINVKATSYTAIFSLTQNGKTIEEAEAAIRARTSIFEDLLKQEHISSENIFIDPISLIPLYEAEVTEKKLSRTFNEIPNGFEIKKNVHITFDDQRQINNIITIAAKAEVYDLVKVDYDVANKDMILAQLRNDALAILLEKKATMEKAGVHIRFTNLGEKQGSVYPAERYAQYTAYKTGTTPYFAASYKKEKAVNVQYNYADKQKTSYYDKVTDKQFDKVINTVVNEPMVEIYISLKGSFSIYDAENEAEEKNYNKKIKELHLKELEAGIELKKKEAAAPIVKKKITS